MSTETAMARVRHFVHGGLECNPEYDDPELLEDDKERFDELLRDAVAEATDPLRAAALRVVEASAHVLDPAPAMSERQALVSAIADLAKLVKP